MILFRKGNQVYLRNYCVAVDFKNRAYSEYPYISTLLCKSGCYSNTFDWNENNKKTEIPDYILKYYKGGGHTVGGERKHRRGTSDMGQTTLLIDESLKKFEITRSEGETLLNFIAQNVPSAFEELPDDVFGLFCHKLQEDAKYCPKYLFFFATEKVVEFEAWSDFWMPSKYIVTDANMNPIDVNEMMNVLNKILVNK